MRSVINGTNLGTPICLALGVHLYTTLCEIATYKLLLKSPNRSLLWCSRFLWIEIETTHKVGNLLPVISRVTPLKTNITLENPRFSIGSTSSNGGFSSVMLVVRGV